MPGIVVPRRLPAAIRPVNPRRCRSRHRQEACCAPAPGSCQYEPSCPRPQCLFLYRAVLQTACSESLSRPGRLRRSTDPSPASAARTRSRGLPRRSGPLCASLGPRCTLRRCRALRGAPSSCSPVRLARQGALRSGPARFAPEGTAGCGAAPSAGPPRAAFAVAALIVALGFPSCALRCLALRGRFHFDAGAAGL